MNSRLARRTACRTQVRRDSCAKLEPGSNCAQAPNLHFACTREAAAHGRIRALIIALGCLALCAAPNTSLAETEIPDATETTSTTVLQESKSVV